jgi:hypothetical protein
MLVAADAMSRAALGNERNDMNSIENRPLRNAPDDDIDDLDGEEAAQSDRSVQGEQDRSRNRSQGGGGQANKRESGGGQPGGDHSSRGMDPKRTGYRDESSSGGSGQTRDRSGDKAR